jgi:hypothetical protein
MYKCKNYIKSRSHIFFVSIVNASSMVWRRHISLICNIFWFSLWIFISMLMTFVPLTAHWLLRVELPVFGLTSRDQRSKSKLRTDATSWRSEGPFKYILPWEPLSDRFGLKPWNTRLERCILPCPAT